GRIMTIAERDVITIPPSLPIKEASEKMVRNGVRRLPVTSPGTEKLHGMLVTRDIVDFLGGGEKNQIIEKKHNHNFLSAINDPSKIIMDRDAPYADNKSSISDVAKILIEKNVGGTPIVDKERKVVGIVSERDFARYIPSPAQTRVEAHMTQNVVTAEPDLFLIDIMKRMINEGFRRLPVVDNNKLVGVITSVDVLEYFGTSEMFEHMSSGDAKDAMAIEIRELMTKNPITVDPKADLGETARRMEKHGYGGLPVVENGKLVGLITERDIVELLT
ncbi:hypothetical protein AKJ40_01625, partial [candidate division MSBL1 archaeon SCGC-AAA259M10]